MSKLIYKYDGGDGEASSYVVEKHGRHNSVELLRDPNDNSWAGIAKGVSCGYIDDTGNGIVLEISEFNQGLTGCRKTIPLSYCEAVEAYLLLQAYIDAGDDDRPELGKTQIRKYKEIEID